MADNKFVVALERALRKRKDVHSWRFRLNFSTELEVGISQGDLGGPYAPPTMSEGLSSSLYIVWKNKSVTKTTVEPHHFEKLSTSIDSWKTQAFKDPDAAPVLAPQEYPAVKVYDPKVASLLQDPSHLFQVLDAFQKVFTRKKVPNVDASVSCDVTETYLRSSTGMSLDTPSTEFSFYCYADGQYGDEKEKRKFISVADAKSLALHVAQVYKISGKQAKLQSGMTDVIFAPNVMEELLGHFVENNLSGGAVVKKQSAFSSVDFKKRKKVFSDRLSVVLNGTEAYSSDAFPSDAEGVASGVHNLIEKGRLVSPELNVKYGRKMKMAPTGPGEVVYKVEKAVPLNKMIASVRSGIIIYGVLGMHTQSAVTGEYSLPCYLVLKIEKGKLVGSGKVSIAGNFFADLRDKKTAFAYDPRDPKRLAMRVRRKVSVMQ